ncbi:MAG: DNA-binding response regulator [Actinobacteria bacterium]|nr:MAG: DNA-binding response regulator [Actinomycetota bacterium]
MSQTVLIIEDDTAIREAVEVVLERAGLHTMTTPYGREGLRMLYERRPDIVVLDVGLPDIDGWDVLERIRDVSDIPVLMLTARGLEHEKVRGFQGGADDYVTKPFSNAELAQRVMAILRRVDQTTIASVYEDRNVRIDRTARDVSVGSDRIDLSVLDYQLLLAFVDHAGQVLSRGQLLELAWKDPLRIGPDRVKFAVGRLRRKLGWTGSSPINSVRGVGYRYQRDM